MTPARILLVDDDVSYSREMQEYLGLHGFDVEVLHDPMQFALAVDRVAPDCVLLDKVLGRMSGNELLLRLRSAHETPCIIVTGHPNPTERIVNLELGADDEVEKSVSPRELLARIRAIMRRQSRGAFEVSAPPASRPGAAVGSWSLSLTGLQLLKPDGTVCHLTTAEFDTLRALSESKGKPLSRAALLERVFRRSAAPDDRAVDTAVRKIRKKIVDAGGPDVIRSIRNIGYVFVGFDDQP